MPFKFVRLQQAHDGPSIQCMVLFVQLFNFIFKVPGAKADSIRKACSPALFK